MIEAIRTHGLHAATQALAATPEEAHVWARRHGQWPVIVKPLASAGSDGVALCHSHDEIDAAFAKCLGRNNFMGGFNDRLLIQSYLRGPQYIVNTVSAGGRHYVTDVWSMRVSVHGTLVIPGGIDLLDPTSKRAQALIAYTLRVLKALGIENGAAHTELKWTPEGPALIETGARIMGAAMDQASYEAACQPSHASVYAWVLAASEQKRAHLFDRQGYSITREMTKLLFNFSVSGTITGAAGLARLQTLPSFHAHYRGLKPGDAVWKTADWLCRGGVVYLIHDDRAQIDADIVTFRQWERAGALYAVEPASHEAEAA